MNAEPDRAEADAAEEENGGAEEEAAVTESAAEEVTVDDPLADLQATADANWD